MYILYIPIYAPAFSRFIGVRLVRCFFLLHVSESIVKWSGGSVVGGLYWSFLENNCSGAFKHVCLQIFHTNTKSPAFSAESFGWSWKHRTYWASHVLSKEKPHVRLVHAIPCFPLLRVRPSTARAGVPWGYPLPLGGQVPPIGPHLAFGDKHVISPRSIPTFLN